MNKLESHKKKSIRIPISLSLGVAVDLLKELAPFTVEQFTHLARTWGTRRRRCSEKPRH